MGFEARKKPESRRLLGARCDRHNTRAPQFLLDVLSGPSEWWRMATTKQHDGTFTFDAATRHLSDAITQAWTWRIFRKHAADLGGLPARRTPTFTTEEGAEKWLETVKAWFAIVHPDSGFHPVLNPLASGFANITKATLGRYGVAISSPEGEDLGWTPITYHQRNRGWRREGWDWCDGMYGLNEYFAERAPEELTASPRRADDLSEWIDEKMAPITTAILAALSNGIVAGTTEQGFGFSFLAENSYPAEKI